MGQKTRHSVILSTLPVPYHSCPPTSLSCPYLLPVLSLPCPCLVLNLLPFPPETWSSTNPEASGLVLELNPNRRPREKNLIFRKILVNWGTLLKECLMKGTI